MLISRDDQSETFLNSDILNEDFFISIVENKLNITKENFRICLVLITTASAKTENYMSNVYRVKIKVELAETKELTIVDVVLKVILDIYEIFGKFGIFERECIIHEDVILKLEKIWMEKANKAIQFAPKCHKILKTPYEIIVLDDLKSLGYRVRDRKIGLNVQESKFALKKLAKFHAAGAVLFQKHGVVHNILDRKESITPEMKREEMNMLGVTLMQLYDSLIAHIKTYGGCNIYADKMAAWDRQKIMRNWLNLVKPMKCGMVVLTHADYWVNNLMFKLNESNELEDMQILDFQSSVWGTPALDLHYFLISSIHDDFKIKFYDEFIKYYHDEFVGSLRELKYDHYIPTLDELYEELLEKSQNVAMSMIYILFSAKYESTAEFDLDYVTLNDNKDEEFFDRIYGNETYKKALQLWLPLFDERGYLDFMLPDDLKPDGEKINLTQIDDQEKVVAS